MSINHHPFGSSSELACTCMPIHNNNMVIVTSTESTTSWLSAYYTILQHCWNKHHHIDRNSYHDINIIIIIIMDPSLHHWSIPIHPSNRWYHWIHASWTISTTFASIVIMLWRMGWIRNNHYQTRYGRQMSWICIRLLSFQWISNHVCWSSE